ncbi:MAG: exosortase-associated EpsI family protein [Opitutaceae bacterium]
MNEKPRRWWLRGSLLVPVGVLLAAVALQGIAVFRETPQPRGPHLDAHVPASVRGWRVRNLPLGQTESVRDAVVKTLNYDEVVYREYARPAVAFGVYVAYWGAGKMPTRLVASHTPDRCWTENGWTCGEMRFRQQLSVRDRPLQPAEWRQFQPPNGGPPVYVLYWHLVDGRVLDQGGRFNAVPHPLHWWKDAVQQAFRGSREQYFIRVTSTAPFERIWNDPGFVEVLRGLQTLGLEAAPTAGATPTP